MRNKMMAGAVIAIILLSAVVLWYFSPSNVSIANLEAPKELGIGELGDLKITLQNNALKDVNVSINVKNAFVDEKGESLKTGQILTDENNTYRSLDAVLLKPGMNDITVFMGYQVPGTQKVEVEVYQRGKLADSRTVEVNVPTSKIKITVFDHIGSNGSDEIHAVYGYLENTGKGYAPGVVVNISVINESTNATVSTVTRIDSIMSYRDMLNLGRTTEPLVVWSSRNSTDDPVTGMMTTITTESYAPVVVIELSKGKPSTEKYLMSPIVVKGKIGDKYRVVVTATWRDQVVSSEVSIPG